MKALCFSNKSMSFVLFCFLFGEECGPKSSKPLCAEQHHMAIIHDSLFSSLTPTPLVITLVF